MADLGEIQKKQAEAASFAMRMTEEKDPERLKEMAEQLQAKCADLARMAKALEAAVAPAGSSGPETRVVLTPEQRQRIAEATGVGVEVVTLRDTPGRTWSRGLQGADPREIEAAAAQQAARSRLIAETRKRVEAVIHELEKLDSPELAETIAELRRDPTLGLKDKGG
jgi:DNA-binding MarR family transcriptional regulator